jgi:hypothetical protein
MPSLSLSRRVGLVLAAAAGAALLLVLTLVLAVTLFWVAVGLALVAGIALLHLIYLPRASAYLRLPTDQLALALLPLLVLAGWGLTGHVNGGIIGIVLWALGIGAPRLAAAYALRRARDRQARWTIDVTPKPGATARLALLPGARLVQQPQRGRVEVELEAAE